MKQKQMAMLQQASLVFFAIFSIGFFQNCSKVSFKELPAENGGLGVVTEPPPDITDIPVVNLRTVEQRVSSVANSKVDVLFVVDNSGSMKEEQQGMADKIAGFMNIIGELDWQVALTTTDARATSEDLPRDGQLRTFQANPGTKVLKKSQNSLIEAQQLLAQAILVGVSGSGDERGIQVTRRSIELRRDSVEHREFHRSDSVLMVILISDENECSDGKCLTVQSNNHPVQAMNFMANEFGSQKVVKFNSIIKVPNDSACTTAANTGHAYYELSQITSGIVGSVCAQNYSQILESLGRKTLELIKSVNLQCVPVDTNKDGLSDIQMRNAYGMSVMTGYKLEGRTLIFDQALITGDYTIRYTCAN